MIGKSRLLSSTSLTAMVLTAGLLFSAGTAEALTCDPPGAAALAATAIIDPYTHTMGVSVATSVISEVDTQASNIITAMGDDFSSYFGMISSASLGGACNNLSSCMQMWFAQLGTTNTNNQMAGTMVNARAADAQMNAQYTQGLQTKQADLAIQNGVGNNAYTANNICTQATLASGMTSASEGYRNALLGYGGAGGSTPPTGASTNTGDYVPTNTETDDLNSLYTNAMPYFDAASDESGGGSPALAHLDTNVFAFDNSLSWDSNTQKGWEQFTSYMNGLQPENPGKDSSYRNAPEGHAAVIAQREKIAFRRLAQLAFSSQAAERAPTSSGAASSVNAIFTAAGLTGPIVGGSTSRDAIMNALFEQTAEDGSTIANVQSMSSDLQALKYIAVNTMMGNYLNYERYMYERRNYMVNAALLELETRRTNFQQNP